jgi:hypothetical protein
VVVRLGIDRRPLSPRERVVNGVELLKEYAAHDLDEHERAKALELLRGTPDTAAALVAPLTALLEGLQPPPASRSRVGRLYAAARGAVLSVPRWRLVRRAAFGLVFLYTTTALLDAGYVLQARPSTRGWLHLAAAGASFLISSAALGMWVRSRWAPDWRGRALRWFELSMLVQVLVVQLFRLLDAQFGGFLSVTYGVALYGLARALQARERHDHPAADER